MSTSSLLGEDGSTQAEDRLDPIGRFSDRVGDYVKYRPGYPAEAVDAVLAGLGPAGQVVAADIGAGTGISSRLLADRGVRVIAVEPGREMRASAQPHPNVTWRNGTAEATGLPLHIVDLVVCAQSFHWFRPAEALREFARILKPNGRLALVWNARSRRDPFTVGYRRAIEEVGGESVMERTAFDPQVVARNGLFTCPERTDFPNLQRLDLAGLIGRSHSASYVPRSGPSGERLLTLLRHLYEAHADAAGLVTLVYETEVYRAARDLAL